MLSEELLKKVRLIEISTRRVIDDVLSGNYRSHFKGQGLQFSDHRLYVAGDDVRHIDWKASARTREPVVKKYEEERELNVFLVIDLSASGHFGSKEKLKSEAIAEIAAMLAHAAIHTGDKIGALIFAGAVEKIIPPKKGRGHVLRIVRDILTFEPKSKGTNLSGALDTASRIMKHSGIVFILSDFIAEGYSLPLKRLARRHDTVAVRVNDGREWSVPEMGSLFIVDPESGEEGLVDTRSYRFKTWLSQYRKKSNEDLVQLFRSSGVEELKIETREDYAEAVVRFFRARSSKRKRA